MLCALVRIRGQVYSDAKKGGPRRSRGCQYPPPAVVAVAVSMNFDTRLKITTIYPPYFVRFATVHDGLDRNPGFTVISTV
jgi:hypothetical protein